MLKYIIKYYFYLFYLWGYLWVHLMVYLTIHWWGYFNYFLLGYGIYISKTYFKKFVYNKDIKMDILYQKYIQKYNLYNLINLIQYKN